MPRNSSGVYTLPSAAFVTLTTIASSPVNANMSDIGNALTQSIDTTGLSTMTGPFVAAAGSAAAPSITFNLVKTAGYYLSAANEMSYSFSSTQRHKWNTSGLTMVSSDLKDKNGNPCLAIPIGLIVPYAGSSAPNLWLFCDGSAKSQATYASLFALIGTTYGNPGGGNFNLPDLRGRAPFGQDNMGGVAANRITTAGSGVDGTTIGSSGGGQNITILQANLPNLNWPSSGGTHTHTYTAPNTSSGAGGGGSQLVTSSSSANTSSASTGISLASGGSGTALASMSPTIILNYIIYAGV